jgi:hypothetical protein
VLRVNRKAAATIARGRAKALRYRVRRRNKLAATKTRKNTNKKKHPDPVGEATTANAELKPGVTKTKKKHGSKDPPLRQQADDGGRH